MAAVYNFVYLLRLYVCMSRCCIDRRSIERSIARQAILLQNIMYLLPSYSLYGYHNMRRSLYRDVPAPLLEPASCRGIPMFLYSQAIVTSYLMRGQLANANPSTIPLTLITRIYLLLQDNTINTSLQQRKHQTRLPLQLPQSIQYFRGRFSCHGI